MQYMLAAATRYYLLARELRDVDWLVMWDATCYRVVRDVYWLVGTGACGEHRAGADGSGT